MLWDGDQACFHQATPLTSHMWQNRLHALACKWIKFNTTAGGSNAEGAGQADDAGSNFMKIADAVKCGNI